jgi:hypothetical protein
LTIFAFLDEKFLNAGCCITLVNNGHALQKLGKLLEVALNMLIRDLVPKHIDKLNAGSFEEVQLVNLSLLQLWQDQCLDVVEESRLRNFQVSCPVSIGV